MQRLSSISLTYKLTLITLGVGLVGVAVVALFAQQATQREFSRFIVSQARNEFVRLVADYYRSNGSWDGLLATLPRANRPGPNPPPPPPNAQRTPPTEQPSNAQPDDRAAPPASFVLFDSRGCIVTPSPPFRPNECLTPNRLAAGTPVMVRDRQVGTVLIVNPIPNLGAIERAFLNAMSSALRNAALVATALALILGLFLARMVTRPLKELTTAIHAMSGSNLKQELAVTSHDEFGEVAIAFNQMSEKLTRADQRQRQMTAEIAHELRNPLVVITGYIESMRDGVLQPTAERLAMLHEEGQHLQHLVDDLWTLARADAGELVLNRRHVTVQELLQRTVTAYNDMARLNEITLSLTEPVPTLVVDVDPERMAQVLGNLVANALRYTPNGGTIQLGAQECGTMVAITVRDSGVGIDPAHLPFVFERFYRADSAREATANESGLGLAIVKSIVTAHDGVISAASTQGEGATITIALPVVGDER